MGAKHDDFFGDSRLSDGRERDLLAARLKLIDGDLGRGMDLDVGLDTWVKPMRRHVT